MKARPNIGRLLAQAPTFVAKGADNHGSVTTITYALPAGVQQNDILLLCLETYVTDVITPPAGYAHLPGSPFVDGSNLTMGHVLWKRHSGSESAPQIADIVDHKTGYTIAIRGCVPSGNPWDVVNTGDGVAGLSQSAPTGLTTTVDKTLVYLFAANGHDPSAVTVTTYYSAWSCAALGGTMTERGDLHANDGNGGGIGCAEGVKATAGAVGTITYTIIDAETTAWLAVAFKAPGT